MTVFRTAVKWGQLLLSSLVVLAGIGAPAVTQANDPSLCAEAVVSDGVLMALSFGDGQAVFRASNDPATEIELVHYLDGNDCGPVLVDSYGMEGGEPRLEDAFAHIHQGEPLLLAIVSWPHNHRGLGMTGRFYSVYVYHQGGRDGQGFGGLQLHQALSRRQGMSGVVGTLEGGEPSSFAGVARFGAIALLATLAPPSEQEEGWRSLCNPEGKQMELNACAVTAQIDARRALDDLLVRLAAFYSDAPLFIAALEDAQQGWQTQVERDLEQLFPLAPGQEYRVMYGSSYPMQHALAYAHLIRQRVEFLGSFWLPMDARRD